MRIKEALESSNRWWKEEFKLEFKHREVYDEIKEFIDKRQIIALIGLRRVGKTTIMLKLIEESIREYGARNIIYFSFDDFREIRLNEVLNAYSRLLNKELKKERYLVLFDEIQKIEGWEEQIKRIYDDHNNIKLIISGSESLFIRKKSRESLAGRMFEFQIRTLSFKEYLDFRNKKFDNLNLYKEDILKEFNQFILTNGFPELVNETKEFIEKYLKENVIEKIIYKDIPQITSIRDVAVFDSILQIIMKDPGELINIDEMAKEVGASRQTISIYLDYLEKAFLIKKLYNFSKNARKTQRKAKKYYPCIILPQTIYESEMFGKVFETFLVLQLNAEYFWRDAYKNEVDVVLIKKEIFPIEIKVSKIQEKPLKLFMKKFKLKKGLILTYEKEEKIIFDGKEISITPFYKYLL